MQRLVSVRGLRVILAELGGRGRSGTGALRDHLDRRALGDRRPESVLEPLMARLLYGDLGIGTVEYQPTLSFEGVIVRPDFLVVDARVVVEVDGLDAHATRGALDSDLERQNLLIRHGLLVLRYTVTHLRRPAKVAAEIRAVCRERLAALFDPAAFSGDPRGAVPSESPEFESQRSGNDTTDSRSVMAWSGSPTLIVVMPMARAGLRLMPRSSRKTTSVGSTAASSHASS